LDERNPYKPPPSLETDSYDVGDGSHRGAQGVLFAWVAVFVVNLAAPLLFGCMVTEKGGRIGMAIATILCFAAGCWVCANVGEIGVFLIVGGIPIGISQLFPVLQMAAGFVAMTLGHVVGLVDSAHATNELGGFLLTVVTGVLLMSLSVASGFVIQRFVIDRWTARV
jgi:hypothetical protein